MVGKISMKKLIVIFIIEIFITGCNTYKTDDLTLPNKSELKKI